VGNRVGDEVVQLYVRDLVASVTRPVKELKGFQRITLSPSQKRRVEFQLTRERLAFTIARCVSSSNREHSGSQSA